MKVCSQKILGQSKRLDLLLKMPFFDNRLYDRIPKLLSSSRRISNNIVIPDFQNKFPIQFYQTEQTILTSIIHLKFHQLDQPKLVSISLTCYILLTVRSSLFPKTEIQRQSLNIFCLILSCQFYVPQPLSVHNIMI